MFIIILFQQRRAFATATSTPKKDLIIIGTSDTYTTVVAKHTVKSNSSKAIAEFPEMAIRSTFEHHGMLKLN